MSDCRRIGLLLALLLPSVAAAQDRAALERRARHLESLREEAARQVELALAARREPVETIAAGSLVVIARPADAALVRPAVATAWARLDSLYGDEAGRLGQHRMLFYMQGHPLTNVAATGKLQHVMVGPDATEADVTFALTRAGSAAIRDELDGALNNWIGAQLLPDIGLAQAQSRVYVELVTAPSVAVRQCYAGVLDACGSALALNGGDLIGQWYDPTERRAMVRLTREVRASLRPAVDACLLAQADSACLSVLRAIAVSPPLSNDARVSFARLALTSGGRPAFTRLLQNPGAPIGDRLARAAGLPRDSLLRRWRSEIVAARPRPVTLAPAMGWMALGWTVVFGLLALRSTRWR